VRHEVVRLTHDKYNDFPEGHSVKKAEKAHVQLLDNGWVDSDSDSGRQSMRLQYREGHHHNPGGPIDGVMRMDRGIAVKFGPGIGDKDKEDLRMAVHTKHRRFTTNILMGATKATINSNFGEPGPHGRRKTTAIFDFPEDHPPVAIDERTVDIPEHFMSEAARANKRQSSNKRGSNPDLGLPQDPGQSSRPSKKPKKPKKPRPSDNPAPPGHPDLHP